MATNQHQLPTNRTALFSSALLICASLVTLALTPSPSKQNTFVPFVLAAFPDPNDLADQLTIHCGGCVVQVHPYTDGDDPPFFHVNLWNHDELLLSEPSGCPSPPAPPDRHPFVLNLSTTRQRRLSPPSGERNTLAGPSDRSEVAVDAALSWLAAHQSRDGSWSFGHSSGLCAGRCQNPGELKNAKNAATGLALLAYLGAGESHIEGRYQYVVDAGLRFLIASQKPVGTTRSWHEDVGNSYIDSHAIATTAICEALQVAQDPIARPRSPKATDEMTDSERVAWHEEIERVQRRKSEAIERQRLADSAQAAIDHLIDEQQRSGAWRIGNDEGNTLITGSAILALRSGYRAKTKVRIASVIGASKFLDSVQAGDYGSTYHFTPEKNDASDRIKHSTAIGLLCRMYLGWSRDHPGIVEGATQIAKWRPSVEGETDMYFNHYATQVMYHCGGEPWKKWNVAMRDYLVKTQATLDHEHGSWYFGSIERKSAGGRLFDTTLSAMTLQVYYRYPRIYPSKSVGDNPKNDQP